jgi:hypothetical protein
MPRLRPDQYDCNKPPILPTPGEHPSWAEQRQNVYGERLPELQEEAIAELRKDLQAEAERKQAKMEAQIEEQMERVVGTVKNKIAKDNAPPPKAKKKDLLGAIQITKSGAMASGETRIPPANSEADVMAGLAGARAAVSAIGRAAAGK